MNMGSIPLIMPMDDEQRRAYVISHAKVLEEPPKGVEITLANFRIYEIIRRWGVTNMFDVRMVEKCTHLTIKQQIYIWSNYEALYAKYADKLDEQELSNVAHMMRQLEDENESDDEEDDDEEEDEEDDDNDDEVTEIDTKIRDSINDPCTNCGSTKYRLERFVNGADGHVCARCGNNTFGSIRGR